MTTWHCTRCTNRITLHITPTHPPTCTRHTPPHPMTPHKPRK